MISDKKGITVAVSNSSVIIFAFVQHEAQRADSEPSEAALFFHSLQSVTARATVWVSSTAGWCISSPSGTRAQREEAESPAFPSQLGH